MKLVLRSEAQRLRRGFSFTASLLIHVFVLGWVVLGPVLPPEPARNPYQQEVRSHKIVWYSLRESLPEIEPAEPSSKKRPRRARTAAQHSLIAGPKETPQPPQLIWTPAPQVETSRILPSPNIIALGPQFKPVRPFQPAPMEEQHSPRPALPAAPDLALAAAVRPPLTDLLPPAQPARRTFIPPLEAPRALATHPPIDLPAPPAASIHQSTGPSLAIVGLFPTRNPEIPVPKTSQQAGFSAGPQQRPEGAIEASTSQLVVPGLLAHGEEKTQPSLIASPESPTSRRNLQAAARSINAGPPPEAASQQTVRLSNAPDPRLEGRIVYAIAIQMPNITSYTGSWLVWFAEREPPPDSLHRQQAHPDMRAPLPVHKVDPKYVPAAVEERIEGKVRLAAIIRKDGHVDTVEVVRGLDERLDRSAGEALAKWEFEPAMRDGLPIDVDAVFEIPFHLAPRVPK